VVRGTFSPARAWWPAVVSRLARTLCAAGPFCSLRRASDALQAQAYHLRLAPRPVGAVLRQRHAHVVPTSAAQAVRSGPSRTAFRVRSLARVQSQSFTAPPSASSRLRITLRSTGPSTAGQLGPSSAVGLSCAGRAKLPCRSGPVSSNVRRHKQDRRDSSPSEQASDL
jgi:hypothetical protein